MSQDSPVMLLDTNIWIDCYLEQRAGCKAARDLIALADDRNITISYASTSTKDVFYIINDSLRQSARAEKKVLSEADAKGCLAMTWGCLNHMAEIAVAAPIGEPQVWLARHYRDLHEDYEDGLVLAAVETSKADYFITGDKRLTGKCAAPTFTATEMLAFLKAQG